MRIRRHFTIEGASPYEAISFRSATSEIRNPDGSVVFSQTDIEVPADWSQVACDVLAQKYFRKAGVPESLEQVPEEGVPEWLWHSKANGPETSGENSAKQVFDRLAGTWTYWFNTGLHWAYGIDGPSQGHFYVDHLTGRLTKSNSAYEHPQPHACFIQGINDDLVNEGGIMDLWTREARLFKYGSGTGTNFSSLRGEDEKLSGGGKSSGLMSFLKIGDRAAGAIKSGGTTRRAAKMVIVDIDHPDVEHFIEWKVIEEQKVAALVAGSKLAAQHLNAVMKACINCEGSGDDCFDPTKNPALRREVKAARKAMISDNYIERAIAFAKQGYSQIDFRTYDTDWDSEAYLSVSGQNSNNSVRVTDEFLRAVENDDDWNLTFRRDGRIAKTLPARELWDSVSHGPAPIPASNSIPRSTTGTRARPVARSAPPIRARNTCSWTIRRAISRRSI
jgi:ribonucleoside-diphosphate reductase alpha chain